MEIAIFENMPETRSNDSMLFPEFSRERPFVMYFEMVYPNTCWFA